MKRNGLDFVDVLCGKLDDLADGVVVDAVDDGNNQRDFDPDARQILDRSNFHVEQVADAAMLVLFFADAVEL